MYPTYDTMLKFWAVYFYNNESFFDGDPLSNLAHIFNGYLDTFYFLFAYWIAIIVLFYKAVCLNSKYIPTFVIMMCLVGLTWTNFMNLTYFTFATVFSLFFMEKYKSKYIMYIPVIFVAYLMHPGILLVLLPSIPLYYLFIREKYKIVIFYLVAYYVFLNILFGHGIELSSSNLIVANLIDSFNAYTSEDSIWGKNVRYLGLKGDAFDFLQTVLFLLVLYYTVKNIEKIKGYVSVSFFLIALVTLVNVLDFYTFSERVRIVITLSSLVVVSILYFNNLLPQRVRFALASLTALQFVFSNILFVQPRHDLFSNAYTSYDISVRAAYVPSLFLVTGIHTFGFSDSYLLKNSKNNG